MDKQRSGQERETDASSHELEPSQARPHLSRSAKLHTLPRGPVSSYLDSRSCTRPPSGAFWEVAPEAPLPPFNFTVMSLFANPRSPELNPGFRPHTSLFRAGSAPPGGAWEGLQGGHGAPWRGGGRY